MTASAFLARLVALNRTDVIGSPGGGGCKQSLTSQLAAGAAGATPTTKARPAARRVPSAPHRSL